MKLRAGETLAYKTRPHWIVFAWAVWLASLAARFFFAAHKVSSAADAQMWLGLVWAFGVCDVEQHGGSEADVRMVSDVLKGRLIKRASGKRKTPD